MSNMRIRWNKQALKKAINTDPGVIAKVTRATESIKESANEMSSDFRTGLYHRGHQSPAVGDTQPVYDGGVRQTSDKVIGIVHPKNYSAMKDNHENNTLLKALGNADC